VECIFLKLFYDLLYCILFCGYKTSKTNVTEANVSQYIHILRRAFEITLSLGRVQQENHFSEEKWTKIKGCFTDLQNF